MWSIHAQPGIGKSQCLGIPGDAFDVVAQPSIGEMAADGHEPRRSSCDLNSAGDIPPKSATSTYLKPKALAVSSVAATPCDFCMSRRL